MRWRRSWHSSTRRCARPRRTQRTPGRHSMYTPISSIMDRIKQSHHTRHTMQVAHRCIGRVCFNMNKPDEAPKGSMVWIVKRGMIQSWREHDCWLWCDVCLIGGAGEVELEQRRKGGRAAGTDQHREGQVRDPPYPKSPIAQSSTLMTARCLTGKWKWASYSYFSFAVCVCDVVPQGQGAGGRARRRTHQVGTLFRFHGSWISK